jgi:PAS domain S-box-containing protein
MTEPATTRAVGENVESGAAAALLQAAREWRATCDAITDGIALLDGEGHVVRCNKALAALLLRPFEAITGRRWEELMAEALGVQGASSYAASHRGRHREVREVRAGDRWLRLLSEPAAVEAGPNDWVVLTVTDVTLEKQREAVLEQSEGRFRTAFEQAAVGIALYTLDGRYLHVNARLCEVLGRREEELLGQPFTALTHPDDAPVQDQGVRQLLAGEVPFFATEKRYIRPEGAAVWVNLTITVVRDPAGNPVQLIGFIEDISEQKKLREELAERNVQLQDAHRRKDEFLAMLAHELRNLLAPVKNAVHVFEIRCASDPVLMQARGIAERQMNHMVRLVDDLLDLSRIGQGKVLLRKEHCDLSRIVRQTAEDYRGTLEPSGLRLSIEVPPEPLWVLGDPTRLSQIVANLLHNASKFTDPGGEVFLRVEAGAASSPVAVVTVRDTGIGIEPEALSRVFESFAQEEGLRDRNRGGLGLGLALVKGLVDLHGGHIEVASEGPGKGTAFTIRLPLLEAVAKAPVATNGSTPLPRRARVLIIDDSRDAAVTLRMLLEIEGHEVETALTGKAGVEKAVAWRPDVVLCDIQLTGGMDGYAVARAIREVPELQGSRLVAVTGLGKDDMEKQAQAAGFNCCLVKPVELPELKRILAADPQEA